jgi:spore cortex formation protein SpoVR/YcgB (stage V sporulation)
MTEKTEKQARYEYIDLMTSALTDHERKLNTLIKRLNKAVSKLSMLTNPEPSQQTEQQQQIIKNDDQPEEDIISLLETARNIL